MSVREPVVAGRFYSGGKRALEKEIAGYIGRVAPRRKAVGVVSPHAGYMYSGPVAGATLSAMEPAACYVIVGPNHTGMGVPFSVFTEGRWRTPLGDVEIDSELAGALVASSRHLEPDVLAHAREHSIEVQLPFLQYLKPGFSFVPICIGAGGRALREIGSDIAKTLKALGREAVIIASSDMTHYETHESARSKDKKAIEAMLALDEESLLETVRQYDISMCGAAPAAVMLSAAKGLGAKRAELVKYQTSGDTSGDYSAVVGYAGLLIE